MRRIIICFAFLILVLGTLWGCGNEGGLNDFTLPPSGPTTIPPCEVHTYDQGVQTIFCGFCNYTEYTCTVCGHVQTRDGLIPEAHEYSSTYATPDCGAKGTTTYTCTNCPYTFDVEDAQVKAHVMDAGVHTDAATCDAKGFTTYSCADCDHTEIVVDTEVRGHDIQSGVYTAAAACGEYGYTTYACSRCDYKDVVTDAIARAHAMDNGTYTAPTTCGEKGFTTFRCTQPGCTHSVVVEDQISQAHDYSNAVFHQATVCGQRSYITYTCYKCNDSFDLETGEPLAHDYDEGTYTAATVCGTYGYTTYVCSRDAEHVHVEYDAAPLAHDHVATPVAGSCAEGDTKGTQYDCSRCDDAYFVADETWIKPDHSWDLTASTDADCHHYATADYECSVCHTTKHEEGNVYGDHIFESGYTIDVQPTTTTEGLKSHHCTVDGCDAKIGEVVIPKLDTDPDLPFIPAN